MKLYHYTDVSGHTEIKRTKVIRCSRRGQQRDGIFGEGVYLTSLNPRDHDKEEIAKNNWNSGWEGNLDKTDCYIEIEISSSDRDLVKVNSRDGRDVYRYKSDIHLDDFDWESGKNSEWSPLQIAGAVLGGVAAAAGIVGVGLLIGSLFSSGDDDDAKKKRDNENRRF